MNPLRELLNEDQSVWLDYISRQLIRGGELKRLVDEDGLHGVTSNPTIFDKAIGGSTDYDDTLREMLANDPKIPVGQLYERVAIEDIQTAADVLRPVYEETGGADGYVSLEVSPHLAHDTQGTIAEAKRLRGAVDRPNLMIKVPATPEGIPAVEELIAGGVNVNITLMFSMSHYEAVANAYRKGLERCPEPAKVASVASFFVSRVDTMVDKALQDIGTEEAKSLLGKIAIANSKIVYQRFREIFHGEGFVALRQRGARVQRPLWASTGTKNPAYSDILYVENLIGRETVNTLPVETLNAFRDHGQVPGQTVREGIDEAAAALAGLQTVGIDLNAIAEKLQQDGVAAFAKSFDSLMATLEKKRDSMIGVELNRQDLHLGKLQSRINRRLKDWQAQQFGSRLWKKDPTLWFTDSVPELTDRLGWLELPQTMRKHVDALRGFAGKAKADGMRHVVVLGMGGSSLAPEVFQQTFGNEPDYPVLMVLDSTHPATVKSVEAKIDLARTIFLVSSKSGTTTETNSFFYYFWNKLKALKPEPGEHFVAITDPGTTLERLAGERRFRAIFTAPEDVGGRYSALTVFGLVPAALIGADVAEVLNRARCMSEACGVGVAAPDNPGLVLGAALAELTLAKRDKVTFLCSPSLSAFPAWAEQLIAESTGKDRKGIVPVATEKLGLPDKYRADRAFVYLRAEGDDNHQLDRQVAALEADGHPVVRIEVKEKTDLGQEFFRWEVAVAAAGAALGIHPFNQPDVQLAKDLAKKAMSTIAGGKQKAAKLKDEVSAADDRALQQAVSSWTSKAKTRDYVSIQAYLEPTSEHDRMLQSICEVLRDRRGAAITLGYGPRFLHSTGQLHKGGPNTVLVLQIIDQPPDDVPVPETDYTFGTLIEAQALGDFTALKQRRRRALRVNLGSDTKTGLERLAEALQS
ncbi:MAG: bifunctional transaldolase/phosoglucose isomerase [Deltaproteobacteria bacterium]|nr:bifunctional transaldolase/phosoglucose isomerase [Deltaproteobacteria bacterium]